MKKQPQIATTLPPILPLPNVDGNPTRHIIWITGPHESGKSTAAAGADPVTPGQPPRTYWIDLENSTATLRTQYGMIVVDNLQQQGDLKYSNLKSAEERLFMAYKDHMENVLQQGGASGCRVFVLDTMDALYMGSNAWTRRNPELFGKHPGQFNGEKGTKFSFASTLQWWEGHLIQLNTIFEVVIVISHVGSKWENDKKVGMKIKGPDLNRIVSLALWMHNPDPNEHEPGIPRNARWVEVKKDRFSGTYQTTLNDLKCNGTLERLVDIGVLDANETVGEDDMRLRRYLRMKTFSLLPRKFPVEHGDGVFDVIRDYLEKPQTAYGVLDAVIHPGEVEQLTEAEILAMQTDKAQAEAQAAQAQLAIQTNAGRVRFAEMLKPHYPTPADIKRAMNELGLPSYTLENHDELFTALLAHAQQRE